MQFCGNPNCDNEATEIAFVSESKDKVTKRPLCSTCYEAYLSGCQHTRFRAVRNLELEIATEIADGGILAANVLFNVLPKTIRAVLADEDFSTKDVFDLFVIEGTLSNPGREYLGSLICDVCVCELEPEDAIRCVAEGCEVVACSDCASTVFDEYQCCEEHRGEG